jgi:phosphatidylinositol alpha-mannosyltransferase
MKIALICPYALSAFGGVQEQTLAMSRELSRRGHEVLVVVPDEDDATNCDTPAAVLRFGRRLSVPANGSKAPVTLSGRASRQALEHVASFAPDVVHMHEPFAPRLGYRTLRSGRWPVVATFHRSGVGPAISLTKPLLRYLGAKITRAAAVSEAARRTALSASGVDATVLYNGFDVDRFVAFPREVPATTELLVIGRLEERKGVATAIEAVLLHNSQSETQWHLTVAGDGPQRAQLEKLAQGSDAISFVGVVTDEQKRRLIRTSSALLAPALFGESFGLVLLEGMASEVSVVASDIDGYRQAAAGHASLFEPGNPQSLETAVVSALRQDDASLDAARTHAASWSMASLMDRYEDLYGEALSAFGSNG